MVLNSSANAKAFLDFPIASVDLKLLVPLAKLYIYFLLVGLDFLYSHCGVAHTGEYHRHFFSFEIDNKLN